jgi:hypothetical protein
MTRSTALRVVVAMGLLTLAAFAKFIAWVLS